MEPEINDAETFKAIDATAFPHIRHAIASTPWAITADKLAQIIELVNLRSSGVRFSAEEIQARIGAASKPMGRVSGSIAVLPVYGVIAQRLDLMTAMSGGTSTERLTKEFRALVADESIGAIVLEVDSPGGAVNGVAELAEEIYAARGQKPIIAHANSLAASAAYWIGTAADELVVTPSGEVGSIGVFGAHVDLSGWHEQTGQKYTLISAGKFKVEGNPYEPLSDEARDAIQARINDYYDMFVSAVAKHRGVKANDVRNGFGEGRVVGAQEAVRLGMADRVETLDATLSRLSGRKPAGRSTGSRGAGTRGSATERARLAARLARAELEG